MNLQRWTRTAGVACCLLSVAIAPRSIAAQQGERQSPIDRIPWAQGPVIGSLGTIAEVEVPAYCRFTDKKGAKMFMDATENIPDGSELGVLLCDDARDADGAQWFVVFSFDESGLVKDDEKASLDANAMLTTLRRGNDAANEVRRDRGWEELEIAGWQRAPYYDSLTHNLTWSLKVREKGAADESVNHSVRLLGRRGVMHADLVADPVNLASAVVAFDSIVGSYEYMPGQRYAEWREGDKVASYGLTALIAGGAGVAAVKLGFFPKIWKLLLGVLLAVKKLIVVLVVGIGAFFKKLFSRRQGGAAAEAAPAQGAKRAANAGRSGQYAPVKPPGVSAPPESYPPAPPGGGARTNG